MIETSKFKEMMLYIFGIVFPFWLSIVSYGLLEKALNIVFWVLFFLTTILFIASSILLTLAKPFCKWRWKSKHKTRLKTSIIGIFRENDKNEKDGRLRPEKSRYFPEDWMNLIKSFKDCNYQIRFIDALNLDETWDDFVAIINPYGEGYPEVDIGKKETFEKIMKYVEDGGVFVNVCGAPFWYAWNPTVKYTSTAGEVYGIAGNGIPTGLIQLTPQSGPLSGQTFTVPGYSISLPNPTYSPKPVQSLVDTLVFHKLGLLVTTGDAELRYVYQNDEDAEKGFNYILEDVFPFIIEFRATRKPTQNFIPMLRAELPLDDNASIEIYPVSYVPHGNGKFLFCGMLMASDENIPYYFVNNEEDKIKSTNKTTNQIMDGHTKLIVRSIHILIEKEKEEYFGNNIQMSQHNKENTLNCKM